jgi:small-conductance mechanosensitive channel/CRP-like cAMP-binding protein
MLDRQQKKFVLQLVLFIWALLLLDFQDRLLGFMASVGLDTLSRALEITISIFAWVAGGWALSGLIQTLVWPRLEKRLAYPPPKLLQNIVTAAIILTIAIAIFGFVLNAPISGIVAGSSVVAAVIGLAVTRMIADVFSGVALSVERSYVLGDWLEIEMRNRPGNSLVGQVVEVNWRATRLKTKADETVVIPNSELARTKFINFSAPQRYYRAEVQVPLSHSVSPDRAKRILMAAVVHTEGIMEEPKPQVVLKKFEPRGVVWCLQFWVADYSQDTLVTRAVQENVLNYLQVAGIELSYNRVDQRLVLRNETEQSEEAPKTRLLKRLDLFAIMGEQPLARIAGAMQRHEFEAQDFIVTQGEAGSSLFVVEEGLVSVLVKDGNGRHRWVAHVPPGGFFGEMALLTGESRTATVQAETQVVCYEIDKEILLPIFQENPELLEKVGELMAARKAQLRRVKKASLEENHEEQQEKHSLLQKMRHFFGIKLW